MGLLFTAAVATVVAGRVKTRTEASLQRRAFSPAPYRIDWEGERVVFDGADRPAGRPAAEKALDEASWDEGAEFIESSKSLIALLQKHPVAGGESCIAEMSQLVRRLQALAGRTDTASRLERARLENKVEAAWSRTKDQCLRLRSA